MLEAMKTLVKIRLDGIDRCIGSRRKKGDGMMDYLTVPESFADGSVNKDLMKITDSKIVIAGQKMHLKNDHPRHSQRGIGERAAKWLQ